MGVTFGEGQAPTGGKAEGAEGELAALRGLRVVCVGVSDAAKLTCGLLRGQGASVSYVRVSAERVDQWSPGVSDRADVGRQVGFDEARGVTENLLGEADVVIDPRSAGVPVLSGWAPEQVRERCNPRAIYVRMPAFSTRDTRWHGRAASQPLLAGLLGAYVLDEDGTATLSRVPISACFAALAGALGIAAGLVARERYGIGQRVEVPEYDATLLAVGARALSVNGQSGADRPSDPWGGPFRCQDGRWVWVNLATPKAVRRFAAEVGCELRWERCGYLGRADLSALSPSRVALEEELRSLFLTRDAATWDAVAVDLGIALTMVRTPEEVAGKGGDRWVGDEHAGFADERTVTLRAAGGAGADADVRALDWAVERAEAATWDLAAPTPTSGARHPLTGARVLDCTQMLAGPLAGRLLAELGASVVKINDPDEDGAGYRWQENRYHTDVNRGKRTMLVDLSREEGRSIAQRLVATADVVLENVRSDAAHRLGLDDVGLRRWAPELCHAHIGAFSLSSRWDAPGYEPNAQSVAGLMSRDERTGMPRMVPFAVDDYGTGLLTAFGVTLALFHRLRNGGPCLVEASLSRTAFFFARAMADGTGAPREGGRQRTGDRLASSRIGVVRMPHERCLWRVQDGWIVAEDSSSTRAAMWSLVDRQERKGGADQEALEMAIALLEGDVVCAALAAVGEVAGPLVRRPWQARQGELEARSVLETHHLSARYTLTAVGNPIQLEATPLRRDLWVARPGEDGPQLLRAMGMGEVAVDELLRAGVVATG